MSYSRIRTSLAIGFSRISCVKKYVRKQVLRSIPYCHGIGDFCDEDVFVVGYPKSGNTWMQNIISGLKYGLHSQQNTNRLVQALVPDVHSQQYYQRFSDSMCFKSHHLPQKGYRNVIYIVRDGRDVAVSYWHYYRSLKGVELSLDEIIESPIGVYGTWSQHVAAWLANPYNANLMLVKYEEMLDDPLAEIKKVVKFLGCDYDEALINDVIKANSFDQLKRKESKYGLGHSVWNDKGCFFRRGVRGSFLDEMPASTIERFNRLNGELLERLSYR